MEEELPPHRRHFKKIKGFLSETAQDLPELGMRRRAIAMNFLEEFKPKPVKPSLVPSADGALEEIIFTIPAYVFEVEDSPLWKVYKDLFLNLPGYTVLHVLLHESLVKEVKDWLQGSNLNSRANLYPIADGYDMFVWAEDDYEIVYDLNDGKTYLVQPHSNRREGDSYVGYKTAKALELERITMPAYFEGGNILIGDDFFLMGADYAVDSMLDLAGVITSANGEKLTETVTAIYKEYFDKDRRLIYVGSSIYVPVEENRKFRRNGIEWTETLHTKNYEGTVQPLFHIDMFITLAGRNKDGKYQLLVGDSRMASEILGQKMIDATAPDVLDDIADFLRKQGFEVIRNPLPATYVDDEEEKTRKWYYATANNALVEIKSDSDKTVWLPTYGYGDWESLKKTDEANRKIWEQLGFKVIMLEDFHPFAENSGALHCIKKYLKRGGVGGREFRS